MIGEGPTTTLPYTVSVTYDQGYTFWDGPLGFLTIVLLMVLGIALIALWAMWVGKKLGLDL